MSVVGCCHGIEIMSKVVLPFQKEINNFAMYTPQLTGETQLRARRTRLKLLRAIAELEGSASFSEIRKTTGLSTGSIYYHLDRMANYVVKDSKHYVITQKGLQLLHEIDSKPPSSPYVSSTPFSSSISIDEQRLTVPKVQSQVSSKRRYDTYGRRLLTKMFGDYAFLSIIIGVLVFISMGLMASTHIIFPSVSSAGKMISNASLISSLSIVALLSISFLIMLKRQMLPSGYRGIILSALTVLSVLVVNILIFSGLGSQISVVSTTF